ncbi:16S rRNA (guanine(527)-N(7))-methyltransferase RsmG [Halorhodospira halophila]|uniref:Ribosomal RNA small subunit methyltransferase G n=1 Tax=Halorhodospira halophila (strain DSM 244 / SL1) TaxID=349124 RepID=RSMG_HALHL|nr:16S rRNA (guanine(527)-N(7))-methyltransferase RsmG [Halorhodospira halophila]A1WSY4.1 RecName: Full=Ribosomal RNA small subunit methyltransferase G; AltName: Full=16S rRNA 7-methylguanosine methyltransferase; Short=16S rRNA m7G methyltransferase [Halorhodospira halophila SL1]ABM60796.1 16S rRNA m(7)G-527 methyltransferase [Halorhodospira halophila SL1]MBK1729382.1 16S rRNA (guanine(527)-N(7))-methyltransferase RsmG [Halorhodospira halophila]
MPRKYLESRLEDLQIELDAPALERLEGFLSLLMRWNRAYNLTAARDVETLIDRHLLDSLVVRRYLPAGALADVGSGAGFPGLVLALIEPDRSVTLIDSNGKKTRFLRQCATELGLHRVQVRQARMEALDDGDFAVVTARAVAPLATLIPGTRGLLAPDGALLALKGERIQEELAELPEALVEALDVHELPAIAGQGRACLVACRAAVHL